MSQVLWSLSAAQQEITNLRQFSVALEHRSGRTFNTFEELHTWTIDNPEAFWKEIWSSNAIQGDMGPPPHLVRAGNLESTRFFPAATLNYARNLLAGEPSVGPGSDALVFHDEQRRTTRISWSDLRISVARLSAAFRDLRLAPSDRVAAILPNIPEAIIGLLATSATGAVWSSCSPDFGTRGILDRFGQITPRILIVPDGYMYAGRTFDLTSKLQEVLAALRSVEHVFVADVTGNAGQVASALATLPHARATPLGLSLLTDVMTLRTETEPRFEELPFSHPLYILFSSGTTGIPKCIVHGAGGILLKHLSEHRLHADVKPGDRLFYFTTLGWMMWNWLVTGLASGATLMLYDGNPFHPDGNILWDFAARERITHFGTSAKYIDAMKKSALSPQSRHPLPALRSILSTGSPLVPESFDYVYSAIKQDVHLASVSGGTDICGCFVLGSPTLPVHRGEIQCAALGLDVDVVDDAGNSITGTKGELVCRNAFPSMPLGFWGDSSGARYRAAYFERFPGIWHHGDFAERTPTGGFVIHGRSDATLNPGGVRIGTAEIYRQVEQLDEVAESIAIGQDWQGDVRIVLFVVLKPGFTLDAAMEARIRAQIRSGASPRHVPSKIVQVSDIPRTKSGKITELAVRDIVHGRPVANKEALANPEALDQFADIEALRN